MPYKTNKELPDNLKKILPVAAQTAYRKGFNAGHKTYGSEEMAAKIGWTAVKDAGFVHDKTKDRWGKK